MLPSTALRGTLKAHVDQSHILAYMHKLHMQKQMRQCWTVL